jgi:hypothetical protein
MADDRFVAPKPVFKKSTDPIAIETTTPNRKDHTPSPTIVQRLNDEGKAQLAAMVARIQAEARAQKKRRRL